MREALGHWLNQRLDGPAAITDLNRLPTGHSRAMFRLDLDTGRTLVIRVEQAGVFGTTGEAEFRVMAALAATGFPVAQVLWSEPTGEVIGQPFFVMEYVAGDEADREDRSLSTAAATDLVRLLQTLHETDDAAVLGSFDSIPSAADATHIQIERWAGIYRSASTEPLPLLEEAAEWLRLEAPPLDNLHVVHADPGPGNLIHQNGRVVAITDWEFAHLGDPMEDWVYLVMMRGARTMAPHAWLDLFKSEVGIEVGESELHYWSVFNLFKGACANRTALEVFRTHRAAPNLAIIGTALHQQFMRRLADLVAAGEDRGHTS